jgi:hypothetical protein
VAGSGTIAAAFAFSFMTSVETIAKPIARAINIYRSVARHDLDMPTKRGLARHIKRLADEGVQDINRLTVHGLSYLRSLERRSPDRGTRSR